MTGRVVELARRPGKDEPMELQMALTLVEGDGLAEDYGKNERRQVTLISAEQWKDVESDLGQSLPWHTRRANVLVEGVTLDPAVGGALRIGDCELEILGETVPCGLMDQLCPGLREALGPDHRGGVYGRVARGGIIEPGAEVKYFPPEH
ncbi:MAG: MOSC domain-containing protein [Planctomycetota bacterium]